MKLTTFWFFCNRPTVGALIGLGSDLAAATAVAKPGDVAAPAEQPPNAGLAAPQGPVSSTQTEHHTLRKPCAAAFSFMTRRTVCCYRRGNQCKQRRRF